MDLKLPKLGEGSDSGVVVSVFVNEGDTIAKDQTILELENEKAVAAVPATAGGVVTKVHVKAGDKISVGQRLLTLSGPTEAASPAPAAAPAKPAGKPIAKPAAKPASAEPEIEAREETEEIAEEESAESVAAPVASPSLRRMARELGINLGKIRGSGPGGRVEMGDVRKYIAKLQTTATKASPAAPTSSTAPAKPAAEQIDFSKWGPVTKKSITPLRNVIARRMWENWNAIPHVTQFDDADFTRLNELRKKYGAAYEAKGSKLTLTPLVLKAVAATLKKHPIFNSSLDEVANEIVLKDYIHLGIAVDTDAGLIVPVIRDVDKKSVLDLAKELEVLAQKARDRKVSGDDLKGGTFTISNQGAIGGAHFTPIVNKPEVAILGLGRGAMKPVVRDGKIEARMMTPLALSYDHRVIDGGSAARFTVDLLAALQDFSEDVVKL
jgi:pyruvate dehydrogenase E2 component (dihydrolipoamide acetyltransferase)